MDADPLGATLTTERGVNGCRFALYSADASAVTLCLFDAPGLNDTARHALERGDDGIWRSFVPGVVAGQHYGYRVDGEWAPDRGLLFNPAKLLLDPYARRIEGQIAGYDGLSPMAPGRGRHRDRRDSAALVPLAVVVDNRFDWGDDAPPRTPWHRSVIYEAHVRGLTRLHPAVPEPLRGTYAGMAQPAVIEHLLGLGVTAVELMPCAAHVSEPRLLELGLSNYWGYNTLAFFAPHPDYACSDPVREFKGLVRALHAAGIEVILDVVYNHTAEGGPAGPMLSFKGIDNRSYYRLAPSDPSRYINDSGCGNSLDVANPPVLRFVLDSLRYWVETMHVDGFRFDLATSLAREHGRFDPGAAFFDCIYQDPVLRGTRLIAEPWDVGHDGYRLGQFPPGWSEWNDRYRDTVRGFWRGDPALVGPLAERLAGSSDRFDHHGRRPWSSVNFITAHDGFTLNDLVSYLGKHNADNREDNRDGHAHNLSDNLGVEGPTDDAGVNAARHRRMRAMLATLFVSQGVPMVLSGDEMLRTQRGNNNAYCHDSPLTWLHWPEDGTGGELAPLIARLAAIRRRFGVLRQSRFLRGTGSESLSGADVTWLRADGERMEMSDWHDAGRRSLAMKLIDHKGVGGSVVVLINGADKARHFHFPPPPGGQLWTRLLDTAFDDGGPGDEPPAARFASRQRYRIAAGTVAIFGDGVAPEYDDACEH